jgi:hypothetical protein
MPSVPAVFCVTAASFVAIPLALAAQPAPSPISKLKPPASAFAAIPPVIKDLPVRKVVLYKSGVGYFEHSGMITGSQRVAIDFTSSQLNDVLQSLTVLDEGGGRIAGVNYNSTTPIAQQLKTLALGLEDFPATIAVYHALRGQRVEVTGAGAPFTGRLVNVEFRKETDKNGVTSEDHYFLIVATDSGALRTAELTDSTSVRMLDASLQKQFNEYLEIVASAQNQQVRHLALEDRGEGPRQLRVSYISEIPVWKSTYRIVFPREANGSAIVQGWAVVDNTVGADWDNVQLSLVAGAPQSFIQPLSQPIYTHRPEIPIATNAQLAPQTHEAAEGITLNAVPAESSAQPISAAPPPAAFGVAGMEASGSAGGSGSGAGFGSGAHGAIGGGMYRSWAGRGGGVFRASDAIQAGDISTSAFDDFFEYAPAQPVTIHKNESAMVPILQETLPVENVTLWSERDARPLRAVWLENKSKLTLDSGSFSIFENGEFAGEGLLDPIHPGEKRLLSYAADQAVKVQQTGREGEHRIHHLAINKDSIVETYMDVVPVTYTASNNGDTDRTLLIEHPRHMGVKGWSLEGDLKPAEETPNLYRFRLQVSAHSTAKLDVRERGPQYYSLDLASNPDQQGFLLELIKNVPDARAQIQPVIDAQSAVSDLDTQIAKSKAAEETAAKDEARDRENITALKSNDAGKRFVDELNRTEDTLQSARKQTGDLEQQKTAAQEKLYQLIGALNLDWDEASK